MVAEIRKTATTTTERKKERNQYMGPTKQIHIVSYCGGVAQRVERWTKKKKKKNYERSKDIMTHSIRG